TILWMIFSFSLLLLWNNWQVHNGKPSLFGGTPPATQTTGQAPTPPAPADTSVPTAPAGTPGSPVAATDAAVPGGTDKPASTSEQVNVKTDVFDLTFDTVGAQLVKAELLKYTGFEGSS